MYLEVFAAEGNAEMIDELYKELAPILLMIRVV
jgi:hypothetical protein